MRLLADENFPGVAVEALRLDGHDILWVRTLAPGISDDEVLARSLSDSRLLLTFDRDFGDLVFQRGADASQGVVLFRFPMSSPDAIARIVTATIRSRTDWQGLFTVVEPGRVRMRPLPRKIH